MQRIRIAPLVALALASAPLTAAAQAAPPEAVIVQLTSGISVQRVSGRSEPGRAGLGLSVGDRLVVPSGGRATILRRSGKMETVGQTLQLRATPGAQQGTLLQKTSKALSEVASAEARTQATRQGMIRPIAGAAVPVSPRNGVTTAEVRPRFVWLSVPDADGYTIQIRDVRTRGAIARYQVGKDTAWTLPAARPALRRGGRFEWTVAPTGGGRAAPPQSFRVASAEEVARVQRELKAIGPAAGDSTARLLLAAVVYRDAGRAYDALRVLERVPADNAYAAQTVNLMRASLYEAIGNEEAAMQARRRAEVPTAP